MFGSPNKRLLMKCLSMMEKGLMSNTPKPDNPYNRRWRKARATFLARSPLCKYCYDKGIVEPATRVDHIIPHKNDWALFWDTSNWQGLCTHCHQSTKQAEEKRAGKPQIGLDGWPIEQGD